MKLKVKILTDGYPRVTMNSDSFIVHNAIVGESFHWEHSETLEFRGDYEINGMNLYNIIPLEDYLLSVISSEMNRDAPIEFLKAHAVISRSWAYGKIKKVHCDNNCVGKMITQNEIIDWQDTSDHDDCDLCNNDHCQRYLGISRIGDRYEISGKVIRETESMILVDKSGVVADARFSKHCGGHTELFSTCWQDTDFSYLQSFDDLFCDLSDMKNNERALFISSIFNDFDINTNFENWEVEIDKQWLRNNILNKFSIDTGKIKTIIPLEMSKSGRIKKLLVDAENPLTIGKELMIRKALSETHLYSSLFHIQDCGETIRLCGKGWGHGVGLCQVGAARMAKEGADFRQILKYYFPETEIESISTIEKE